MNIDRRNELVCPVCGKAKQKEQFNLNPIPSKKEYLHWCKTCTNAKLKEYIEMLGNEGAALWCLCMELGVPFMKEPWEVTYEDIIVKDSTKNIFLYYLDKLNEMEDKPNGIYDSDVMLSDFFSTGYIQTVDSRKQRESDWGKFAKDDGTIDDEAYDYLENTFADYTKDFPEMDANLIRRYRDLAKAELRKRKADESGDIGEIAKAQDNLRKILEMLKLNEFQSKNISDEKRAFEYNVSLIENYRPAECIQLQEYLDKVGYEKEKAILMRSIRNAVAESREYPDIPKEYQ